MKIITWNVNSIRARLPGVLRLLSEQEPDVLLMQETKVVDSEFPVQPIADAGYDLEVSGQPRYNGVAIVSRLQMGDLRKSLPSEFLREQKRVIAARVSGIELWNVYVPNGGSPDHPRFTEKTGFLDELIKLAEERDRNVPMIIAGDFNVAPGELDVHDPVGMDGQICYHPQERIRLARMLDTGLVDTFRMHHSDAREYSWWDYRARSFERGLGMRLDLLLVDEDLSQRSTGCRILKGMRAGERPSDHAPVVLTLDWQSKG